MSKLKVGTYFIDTWRNAKIIGADLLVVVGKNELDDAETLHMSDGRKINFVFVDLVALPVKAGEELLTELQLISELSKEWQLEYDYSLECLKIMKEAR